MYHKINPWRAFDRSDNVMESTRNYPFLVFLRFVAFHRVRLACSCLTICEYCPIVALKYTLNDRQGSFLEYSLL